MFSETVGQKVAREGLKTGGYEYEEILLEVLTLFIGLLN